MVYDFEAIDSLFLEKDRETDRPGTRNIPSIQDVYFITPKLPTKTHTAPVIHGPSLRSSGSIKCFTACNHAHIRSSLTTKINLEIFQKLYAPRLIHVALAVGPWDIHAVSTLHLANGVLHRQKRNLKCAEGLGTPVECEVYSAMWR